MTEKEKIHWEKMMKKGKKRVVIQHGVLGWGIPSAILFTILMSVRDRSISFDGDFFSQLAISLLMFGVGGIFFGMYVWKGVEKKHKNIEK